MKHRAPLDRVAQALLEKETLDAQQLDELLDRRAAGVDGTPRRSATGPRASRRRLRPARLASAAWRRGAIHHVGLAVEDLDDAVATYRAAVRGARRGIARRCRPRAPRQPRCSSATTGSSCSLRPARTRRSAASSRGAALACTTSPTRSTTSRPSWNVLGAEGVDVVDREPRPRAVRASGRVPAPDLDPRRPQRAREPCLSGKIGSILGFRADRLSAMGRWPRRRAEERARETTLLPSSRPRRAPIVALADRG